MKPKLEARVYRKGRLICVGVNSYTNSTKLQRRYGGEKRPFVHAELDAIREAIKKSQLRSELTKQNFNGLSLDQLERIKSIIDEGNK